MSDDKLRAAYNAQIAADAPADRSACPTPEVLLEMAEMGQGGSDANLKVMDHVFSCVYCRADFALLRSVESGGARAGNTVIELQPKRRWLTGPRIAIAASVLFAIGIGNETLRRSRENTVRNVSDASDVVIVAPNANAGVSANAQFVWKKVAGAVTYEVQLLDSAGAVITTYVTSDTVFVPSESDRARLLALKSFDWFVTAKRADGNERRSAVVRVQVTPSGPP